MTAIAAAVPYLTVADADAAIRFYTEVMGGVMKDRMMAEDGKRTMHAEIVIGGASIMLASPFPEMGGAPAPSAGAKTSVAVALAIASAAALDALAETFRQHGAVIEMGPMDAFWGARFCALTDPFGHRWFLNAEPG